MYAMVAMSVCMILNMVVISWCFLCFFIFVMGVLFVACLYESCCVCMFVIITSTSAVV